MSCREDNQGSGSDGALTEWFEQADPAGTSKATSIHSLCAEILACIFEFYVSDGDEVAWSLCYICRLWRQLALSTPTLWNKIAINAESSLNYGSARYQWDVPGLTLPKYSSRGYQLCFTAEQLKEALRLTGSVGLVVDFNYHILGDSSDLNQGLEMLDLVLSPHYSGRLIEFDLTFCGTTPSRVIESYHEEEWSYSFPKLQTLQLRVDSCFFRNALLRRFSTSPVLRDVGIGNPAFSGPLDLCPSLLPMWSRLETLHLWAVLPEELNAILPHLTQLKSLGGLPCHWPNEHTPPTTFPHLEEIRLSCDPNYISSLSLPKLSFLCILDTVDDVNRHLGVETPHKAHIFPTVEVLTADTRYPNWLSKFEFPKVHNFKLLDSLRTPTPALPVQCDLMPLSHPHSLKTFSLNGRWSEPQLCDALSKTNNLEVFVLQPYKKYTRGLNRTLTGEGEGVPIACPKLKEIRCSFGPAKQVPDKNVIWNQLLQIEEARRTLGRPITVHEGSCGLSAASFPSHLL
ncbi:hypothetical protein FRC14_006626 [Serendipita sp. 396]|nr:hypothetical protein FRC14_006626 [Serendipita sp. 396]KAG8828135.1 hypothetical protein FRC19_009219 [Serendipita sp. 401]KAG9058441.1 hypothetical protein FS842_009509 [Serendipita sp. 407]